MNRYIKAILIPSSRSVVYATNAVKDHRKPTFGDIFKVSIPPNRIPTKTLQINVWSKSESQPEICVVSLVWIKICSALKFEFLH